MISQVHLAGVLIQGSISYQCAPAGYTGQQVSGIPQQEAAEGAQL